MKKFIFITVVALTCSFGHVYAQVQHTNCTNSGTDASAIGNDSHGRGNYSFAVGFSTNALGENSFAFGHKVTTTGAYSVAVGYHAVADKRKPRRHHDQQSEAERRFRREWNDPNKVNTHG
jgi:hypothetical protein